MVDPVPLGELVETRADLGKGEPGLWAYWMAQDRIAAHAESKWQKRGRKIVERYRDERPEAMADTHRLNILWSNVETLLPTLYARTPRADVERRFRDQDDVGRLASEILQRTLSYSLETTGFDLVMKAAVKDRLLPGRGVIRILYVPHYGEPLPTGDNPEFEEAQSEAAISDMEADDESKAPDSGPKPEGEPLREVLFEEVKPAYVFWEDYREGPARTWEEVPWTRYRAYMTRDELIDRFGSKLGKQVNLDYLPKGAPDPVKESNVPADLLKKAVVYEIWDKVKKEVVWLAPGTEDVILDKLDDPLRLPNFFPGPDPLLATTSNENRIPIPDFIQYQDQARELDTLTARIDRLTRALKVSGVYPGEDKQVLQQLIDEGTENRLIPVEDWAGFSDKGGLKAFIQWMPVEQIAQTLIQLYQARDKVLQTLYEITGIADIMRGNTQPTETAAAQKLKTNFVTRRVQPQQKDVARFACDTIRLMGAVVCEHFDSKTISLMSGYPQLLPVPPVPPMPAQPPVQQLPPNVVPMQPGMPQQPPSPQMQAYQQQMMAYQQAVQKAQAVQAANQQKQQQFDQAVALLRQDGLTGFRIDIEADSTIAPDEEAEKAARTEFIGQFVPLVEQLVPVSMGNPALANLAKEVVLFGVRGFRVARSLEESIEKAFDALAQMPPQANAGGKGPAQNPQVEQAKIQADMHDTNVKAQTDQMEIAQKAQQAQGQMQLGTERLQAETLQRGQELALQGAEMQQRERLQAMRTDAIGSRMARNLV